MAGYDTRMIMGHSLPALTHDSSLPKMTHYVGVFLVYYFQKVCYLRMSNISLNYGKTEKKIDYKAKIKVFNSIGLHFKNIQYLPNYSNICVNLRLSPGGKLSIGFNGEL